MNTTGRTREPTSARRLAMLLGLTVGLGIVVHQSFFVVAGAIAVGALAVATARVIEEHSANANFVHRRRLAHSRDAA